MMRPTLLALVLSGCSAEYGFSRVEPSAVDAPSAPGQAVAPAAPSPVRQQESLPLRFERVDVSKDASAAVSAQEDPARKVREETFVGGRGATSPVADYLFVVDHSVSMDKILDQVRAGMLSLSQEGVFPAKARIAVMTTLPGDPADLARPHPAATVTPGLAWDPGFLHLVDGARIDAYREHTTPEIAARFPASGCDAWFAPGDTNREGVPCLVANTQIGLTATGVEAGLVAFRQLVEAAEAPLFRPGAAVNVVFVSDTHDPGIRKDAPGAEELLALRPDFALLRDLVLANSLVASFRVHAVAPATACVEGFPNGPAYTRAARDGDGVFLDVCSATDYRPLIEQIARRGAEVQQAVFPLGRGATEVESVTVGVRPVGFSVSPDGRVIVLDEQLPQKSAKVRVRYHY